MKELLEAGVHFGHQTRRWNPKMKPYIFGKRNGIHIVDLQKTLHFFGEAADFIRDLAEGGRNVLFVGTKRQAQDAIREEAMRCGMFYVNHRWLGGTMTNFRTIRKSIDRLKEIEATLEKEDAPLTKKERIRLERQRKKMDRALGGIKDMEDLPDALFVIDTVHEHNAVCEANRLGIPVVAVVDTNCDPEEVDFPVPGNDDAIRAIRLFSARIADNVLEGLNVADDRFVGDDKVSAAADEDGEPASEVAVPESVEETETAAAGTEEPAAVTDDAIVEADDAVVEADDAVVEADDAVVKTDDAVEPKAVAVDKPAESIVAAAVAEENADDAGEAHDAGEADEPAASSNVDAPAAEDKDEDTARA
jgi:small subunit ribosomal protein S2